LKLFSEKGKTSKQANDDRSQKGRTIESNSPQNNVPFRSITAVTAGNAPVRNVPAVTAGNPPARNTAAAARGSVPSRNTPAASRGNAANNNKNHDGKNMGKKQKKPVSKVKSRIRTTIIILLVIVVGFCAFAISLGYYVRSLDTIFPNVWADGIKLSDLTLAEARQKLINEGYEDNADGISVTVVFPDETSFSVNGREVGLSLNAAEAAIEVFNFGRNGTFFENTITYVNSLFNRTSLYDLSSSSFDDSKIYELATEYSLLFNETLFDNNLEIENNSITITRGTGLEPADIYDVFNLALYTLQKAIEENRHLSINYIPEPKDDEAINLQILYNYIHVDPISAEYDPETMSATESAPGRTFDLTEAEAMLNSAALGSRLVIPIITLEPELTQSALNSMIFRDVLTERTTVIAGTSNRLNNITIASRAIHETILNPGELFSFNEIVGPRTEERGFLEAGAFVAGALRDEIGGGICQVSSTLYGSLLFTHLEIVERRPHGMIVSYMTNRDGDTVHGHDATIAWGNIDFKFRNNMELPIRVESTISGRNITIKIIGTKIDDTYIEIETDVISTTPFSIIDRESDEVLLGETVVESPGMTGFVVEIFKLHYDADGELISRTRVSRDSYRVQDRVVLHGTALSLDPPNNNG
jgi:hypothetical protein